MNEVGPRRLGRRRGLDGIRGVAILMVIGFHARIPGFRGGSTGVDIFFALSGFLITTVLVEEWEFHRRVNVGRFYLRRALRLFPALIVLLVTALGVGWITLRNDRPELHSLFVEVASAAGYVTNWVLATKRSFPSASYLGHTWSLAVEEQFYLAWPLILVGLLRLRWSSRSKVLVVVVAAATSAALRLFLIHKRYITHATYGLDTNAATLLFGCALAMAYAWRLPPLVPTSDRLINSLVPVALVFLAAVSVRGDQLPLPGGLEELGVAIGTCLVIAAVLTTNGSLLDPLLESTVLVFIGTISYGLYLWHFAVFGVINSRHFAWSSAELLVAKVSVSFGLALASYYLIERPFLRLKRRFGGRTPAAPGSIA